VELRVLGPIELLGDEGPIRLPAKQRRLLAALAIHAGASRAGDLLIDDLWGSAAPPSARSLLQVYVSQLRKALPRALAISTGGSGYALELSADSCDAVRFEHLVDEGRETLVANPALAASIFQRALGLWRGDAYADFAYEDFARAEVERLEELRLACLEERFDAELALGRHSELLPELRALAPLHPYRERLQRQTMLALYRAGRQSDALDLYRSARGRLRDLGLEPGPDLRALEQRVLQQDPTLDISVSGRRPRAALPTPPNALLAREAELSELRNLIERDDLRLLVLTGAGGSGKTRLALEAARRSAGSFADGAAFVSLAPLRDPALMVSAIAGALELDDLSGDPLTALAGALRSRELLLVLDNAEHLQDATPTFVELLARAPRLTLLVTSRAVLHLSGEIVYPVQPLEDYGAVALFHQRVRDAAARIDPNAANDAAVLQICRRLDGLPLAIELAAARTRTLTPIELAEQLDLRLPVLAGGPRDLPARQRSLEATLAWSYELLEEQEQRDLSRLSVFAGGCTLDAAIAVCEARLDTLTTLIDHNLLQHVPTAAGSRYQMLETVRGYAAERLRRSPDEAAIRRRHAQFYAELMEGANLNPGRLATGGQNLRAALLEQDNVRAALTCAVDDGDVTLGLRLAVAMDQFWTSHDPREGIRWFEELLQPARQYPEPALRAHAFRGYGSCAYIAGDTELGEALWEQSLALFDELDDPHGRAVLLHRLGTAALLRGDTEAAERLVEESHAIHAADDDPVERGWGLAQTTATLGAIARERGEIGRARELLAQSAEMARVVGVPWWQGGMLAELAALSIAAMETEVAESYAREALIIARDLGDRPGRILAVGLLAATAAQHGHIERAKTLWASVRDEDAIAPLGGWRRHREACERFVHEAAGIDFDPRGGQELRVDDAVAIALA